jgi:hypothetical protein
LLLKAFYYNKEFSTKNTVSNTEALACKLFTVGFHDRILRKRETVLRC